MVTHPTSQEKKRRALIDRWREYQVSGEWDCVSDLEAVLEDVKYWLHDGLVHHRLVSDPRRLLRKVEDVLG